MGVVVAGANRNDGTLLEATIEAIVVKRPTPSKEGPQNLCVDGAYDNEPGREVMEEQGYDPHFGGVGDEKPAEKGKGYPARRWVVERTISWLNGYRGILVRWEKKARNYLALLQLACGLIWYRRYHRLAS